MTISSSLLTTPRAIRTRVDTVLAALVDACLRSRNAQSEHVCLRATPSHHPSLGALVEPRERVRRFAEVDGYDGARFVKGLPRLAMSKAQGRDCDEIERAT
jgi:hypothetical protein